MSEVVFKDVEKQTIMINNPTCRLITVFFTMSAGVESYKKLLTMYFNLMEIVRFTIKKLRKEDKFSN